MPPAGWVIAAGAILLGTLAPAGAAEPLEIDILEAYLSEHDKVDDTPHCGRHHGYLLTPQGPVRSPTGGTNRILEEHLTFHVEMRDQPGSGFRPSPDDADRYGIVFLEWHRHFLWAYESWRLDNGHGPLEPWDPSTPMPPSLAYAYPGRGCTEGRNDDPQVRLPTWASVEGGHKTDPMFGHTHLCAFKDLNQFGKSIALEYHWEFHARIGGDMTATQGPRDPAFWAGHQFINGLMDRWWDACEGVAIAGDDALPDTARRMPGPALAPLLLVVLGAAAARTLRRAP